MFGWLTGGVGKAAEGVGNAISTVYKTVKGDKGAVQEHIHDEQMATLAGHAAEFVSRPTRTKWDSLVDGLNRLPRPLITFWVFAVFIWPFFSPESFSAYVISMELVPDEMWSLFLLILSFYFGSRILSSDIRKPRLSPEQREKALAVIKEREKAIVEARTPLIVEVAPTRKPPMPLVFVPTPEPVREPDRQPEIPDDKLSEDAVNKMIASLLVREGGYSNRSEDRGGPTQMGITMATLADWRGASVTEDDVKALTRDEAIKIYRASYFLAPGIDTLPRVIQAQVFDISVNSGQRTAIRMLQKVLNSFGESLAVDGMVGNLTRDACRRYDAAKINNAIVEARLSFYADIVANRPSQRVFMAGWTKRANEFKVAA